MVRKLKTFMLSFACSILLVEAEGFAQVQQPSSKISSLVQELVQEISSDARTGYTSQQLGERHSSKFIFVDNQARIYVRVVATIGKASTLGEKIVQMGGVVLSASDEEIYCLVPYDAMADLAGQNHLLFIGIGPVPQVRTGSVTSAGDAQLFADKARDLFYANGSTVMIGVISDGMQYRQNSINSGDLPGNIISIDNSHECQGTEGTAMMEIVYDLAPGSQLAFGGVGTRNGVPGTPLRMTNLITHMAQAGCKVIVDDIGWPVGYSQFEDREISGSIEQFVQSSGGSYVSACGNDAKIMWAGQSAPSGSHQRKWMLFGADSMLTVTISRSDTLFVELQWADPWTYAQQNLDLHLADASGNILVSSVNGIGQGIPPEENIKRFVTAGTYRVFVEWSNWYQGLPQKHFKLLALGADSVRPQTSGYHVYGHAAAQNAISVAAYNASTPNAVEPFSSRGPSLLVTSGGSTFERQTPKITATDGVQTKVGQNGYFGNPFYGTSAAAPHVAAIAALYYSRFPSHTTGNFFSAMTSSASTIQVGQGGQYNPTSGFGKIRAYDALVKGLTTLASPQVTTNTNWILVRVIGTANIAAERIVTIPASTTTLIEGTVLFGNANARIQVEGTLILTQGASVNPENVVTMGAGRVIGGNFVTVEVTQVDINNAPFDSVGRWRTTYFEKRAAPYRFGSQNNARETFRALQDFKPGTPQKYHDWDTYTYVANHQTFTIDTSHTLYKARFAPTDPTITIKTDLIDLPATTGGNITFHDPWYIDYPDPNYGGNLRNRGMQEPRQFHSRSSPFNPNYDTPFPPSNHPYRGVFLNQGFVGQNAVYYSVGAPSQQIGNFTWNFINWTTTQGSASFQNANAAQTAVVFRSESTTVAARMKAHMASSIPTATGPNNQRKIAFSPSSALFGLIYASGGAVWATAGDGETWWGNEILIGNAPTANRLSRDPAICADHRLGVNGGFHVAWEEVEQNGSTFTHRLFYTKLNGYMQNPQPVQVASWTTTDNRPATPSISFGQNENAVGFVGIVYRNAAGLRLAVHVTGTQDWYNHGVPNTDGSDASSPSVALESHYRNMSTAGWLAAYLVYRQAGHIHFRQAYRLNSSTPEWDQYANVSSGLANLSSHSSPTLTLKPGNYFGTFEPHVTWDALEGGMSEESIEGTESIGGRKVITRQRVGSTWQPVKIISHSFHEGSKPSISYDHQYNRLALFFLCATHIGYTTANPTSGNWGWSTVWNLANAAANPSGGIVSFEGDPGSYPFSVWSTGSSAPYGLVFHYHTHDRESGKMVAGLGGSASKLATRPLPRPLVTTEGSSLTYRRVGAVDLEEVSGSVPQLEGLSGVIALYLDPFELETSGGSNSAIDFSDPNASNGFADWLGTKQRIVPQNGQNAHAQGAVLVLGLEIEEGTTPSLDLPLMQAVIKNANSGQTVSSVFSLTLRDLLPALGRDTVLVVSARRSLASLRGKPMRIDTRIVGLEEGVEPGFGAIYHTSDGGEGTEMQNLASTSSLQTELPTEFALHQNYPNPFNPLTVIRYSVPSGRDLVGGADGQLPVESHVSLKVYDLLGREVATLVNETKGAGYYETTFDASHLGSGVYFYRMQAVPVNGGESFTQVRKFVVMK